MRVLLQVSSRDWNVPAEFAMTTVAPRFRYAKCHKCIVSLLPDWLHGFPGPILLSTGVDKGAGGPGPTPQWPGKKYFVKIEGLSSLPPAKSGRACCDNPTERGISIRCWDAQHVYLYSLFNWNSKVLIKKPGKGDQESKHYFRKRNTWRHFSIHHSTVTRSHRSTNSTLFGRWQQRCGLSLSVLQQHEYQFQQDMLHTMNRSLSSFPKYIISTWLQSSKCLECRLFGAGVELSPTPASGSNATQVYHQCQNTANTNIHHHNY